MRQRYLLVSSAVALFTSTAFGAAPAAATPCTNLSGLPLQHATITSATDNDTGVFVTPTTPPTTLTGLPAFCRVTATLTPMSDSAIRIEVWLPKTTWNSRFLGTGGGGFQGVITYSALALGIQQGFATTNSDLGTGSSGCNPLYCGSAGNMGNPLAIAFGAPASPTTGLFGHPERIKDFGYRAIHLMTLRGKEIANAFYGQGARTAYFAGCSTGGQNALMEAQRFPEDYNGILAGAAAFNRTHLHMAGLASWQNTHATPGRFIQPGQMTLINNAVLAQCVGQDGGVATDQFLTDPRDCKFDPKVLQCTGSNLPPACLSAEQVTTMRNYYGGTKNPRNGQVINPGAARGAETENILALGLAFQERLPEPAFDGLFYWVFGSGFGILSSATNYANFDFDRDVDTVDDQLAKTLNAVSTDLRDFNRRGNMREAVADWSLAPVVEAVQALRGIDMVGAVAFLAELGDLSRFENPRQLMAYLGLTPSERSTGESVKRGGITKAGNTRARRLLIEAAWSYRFPPRVSKDMQTRIGAAPRTAREIAWKAQMRLCGRFRILTRKGKRPTIVVTAIARELSAFIWAIAREVVGSHATANQ